MTAEGYYYVTCGKGDGSDSMDWYIDTTPEEDELILAAYREGKDPNECDELAGILKKAYDEIEKENLEIMEEEEDEYYLECKEEGCSPFDLGLTISVFFNDFEDWIPEEYLIKEEE